MMEKIKIPEGVNVQLDGDFAIVKGKLGEIKKKITHPWTHIELKDNQLTFSSKIDNRKHKKVIKTQKSHFKNMFKGVLEGYTYKMKVCYKHFPITVKVQGDEVIIENFLGERAPRKTQKMPDVKVDVQKQDITITGADLEAVSKTASNIEQAARITRRDRRVFQDGIYITKKRA